MNKISIIVAIYNVEEYLVKCIDSIINQTCKDLQIILVNDGSPDNCGNICDNYAQKDDRITVIHKNNGGVSSARNAGLNVATNGYIQFVDSDDFIELNMCEVLLNTIRENEADLVVCGSSIISNGTVSRHTYRECLYKELSDLKNDFSSLYKSQFFNSPFNKLFKKSLITSPFDEQLSLGEDLIFNLNYIRNCTSIAVINKCLYNYVIGNADSLTSKYRANTFDLILRFTQNINDFCNEKVGTDVDKIGIYYVFINDFFWTIQLLVNIGKQTRREKCILIKDWINHKITRTACNYKFKFDYKRKISFILINNKKVYLLYFYYEFRRLFSKLRGRK